jgi:hypothetical protein
MSNKVMSEIIVKYGLLWRPKMLRNLPEMEAYSIFPLIMSINNLSNECNMTVLSGFHSFGIQHCIKRFGSSVVPIEDCRSYMAY